jgi:formylglycine-generating enzyme required for sulfatase activity
MRTRSFFQTTFAIVAVSASLSHAQQPTRSPGGLGSNLTLEFTQIPAGSFLMGCSRGDVQCNGIELPAHRVTISKPFALAKYEVTQGQYQSVMGTNPSRFKGESNLPVDAVSWTDALEFVNRLNMKKDGYHYRLPTEAEWEYAARGGSTGATPNDLNAIGWVAENSGGKAHLVGQKQANAWGVYDMIGNVTEWVQDTSGMYFSGAQTDPKGPASEITSRIVRGGSWRSVAGKDARMSSRINYAKSSGDDFIGFRVARDAIEPPAPRGGSREAVAPAPKNAPLAFVKIAAGTFMMGCSPGDFLCTSIERPAHSVTISKAFELGKYEVTQEQYLAVMGKNPSNFQGESNLPVEQVSWLDAQEFLTRMNAKRNGHRYRLPSEAEWEYAARAGSTAAGTGLLDAMAWDDSNSGGKTHPVGQKQPNAWGVYDMIGNVWEWVQDDAALYSAAAQTDPVSRAPARMGNMARGASWADIITYVRLSYRLDLGWSERYFNGGFRIVREDM